MEISIQYWTPKILLFTFIIGICLSYPIFYLTVYLLGTIFNLFSFTILWTIVGCILLTFIIGIIATLFVAKLLLWTKYLCAFLLAGILPIFLVAELFFSHPLLLASGTLTVLGLFLLYLTSYFSNRIADTQRTQQLETILRNSLTPPQTLDLTTLTWLTEDKHNFLRYIWKLKLLETAATRINYHISTTQHLEPNPAH